MQEECDGSGDTDAEKQGGVMCSSTAAFRRQAGSWKPREVGALPVKSLTQR